MKVFFEDDPVFKCPCLVCSLLPGRPGISPLLLEKLNRIQQHFYGDGGLPVNLVVSSGRRCPEHNKAVGGKPESAHLLGSAVDIATGGNAEIAYVLVDAAMIWQAQFIEVCPNHIHLDIRATVRPKLITGAG